MDENNREVLSEVIQQFLTEAKDAKPGSDEQKAAFKMAMDAIDRQNDVSKIDEAYREHVEKMEAEKEQRANDEAFKKAESKKNTIIKVIEIVAIGLLVPTMDYAFKHSFAKTCMVWEDSHTMTTTPGKAVRDFFRFKR